MRYLLIFTLALAACGGENAKPPAGNQVLKAANDAANLTPNNPLPSNAAPNAVTNSIPSNVAPLNVAASNTAEKPKIRTFDGKGVVTKINLELVSVEVKHEEIKGLMPAMQMEFYVKEKSQLEALKVGDAVDFVLEDNAGAEQIISIKKAK